MPKPSTHLESEVPARKGDKSQKNGTSMQLVNYLLSDWLGRKPTK